MPIEVITDDEKMLLILKDNVDISDAIKMFDSIMEFKDLDLEVDLNNASCIDFSIVQVLLVAKIIVRSNGTSLVICHKRDE